ncbi:hypothetical protein RHMOL_Rhmol06G0120800 [Rhododendron molle]|uniref:Uncharacterized protein n=1 Tax=Rhododendron molle TaxID=49168 RepID=A0ACC0NCI8_RHOML|nr:hypothetical protein RHMOL_Rhmol06G0120800 [Rhododendron molle]
MEAEERAAEEALGPRVTAVAEAAAVRRPDYTAEAYTPPVPHLFAPSGFSAYTPQRSEYDDETVLRDPLIHIANTWAEPVAASKEVARQAAARAKEQFRIAVRKRPSSEEQRPQKRPKLVLLPTSEDEEEDDEDEEEDEEEGEEEEERSSVRSDSDDSVDDPAYQEDPKDGADDDDDDGDDDGGNTSLKDWFGGED